MNQTRKNWLLAIALTVIAALIIFTTMGIFRGSPITRVLAVIFDLVWLWAAYETIVALANRNKVTDKKEENVTNSK